MRKVSVFLILFFLAGCAVKPVIGEQNAINPTSDKDIIYNILKNGDWLVIRGIKEADNFISVATNMPFSHAAIYDKENNLVIESDSSGVHTTNFDEFLAKSYRLLVVRPMWANETTTPIAVKNAREMIGKKYNYTGLIGIDFPDSYYCTQVAIESYRPFIDENSTINPIPQVISPGRMHHWGRVVYDSGP